MVEKELIETIITRSIESGRILWAAGSQIEEGGIPLPCDVYVINTIAYITEKLLGKGTYGAVYLAYNFKTKKKQAVKVQRSTKYALSQMKISHLFTESYVAQDSTTTYIVLPLYDISLAAWYSRHIKHGRDEASVIRTLRKSAESLQIMHEKGYVHLDIKSNNIMLSEDGIVTVIDFGRTKQIGETDDGFSMEFNDKHYLPPEIMTSASFTVDTSNDVWSLGQMFKSLTSPRPLSMVEFHVLVNSMLSVDQARRPALYDVIASLRKMEASLRKTLHGVNRPLRMVPLPQTRAVTPPVLRQRAVSLAVQPVMHQPMQYYNPPQGFVMPPGCPPCIPPSKPKPSGWLGNWL